MIVIPVLKGMHAEQLWLLSQTMLGMLPKPGLEMVLLLLNNGNTSKVLIFTQLFAINRVPPHPLTLKTSLQGEEGWWVLLSLGDSERLAVRPRSHSQKAAEPG